MINKKMISLVLMVSMILGIVGINYVSADFAVSTAQISVHGDSGIKDGDFENVEYIPSLPGWEARYEESLTEPGGWYGITTDVEKKVSIVDTIDKNGLETKALKFSKVTSGADARVCQMFPANRLCTGYYTVRFDAKNLSATSESDEAYLGVNIRTFGMNNGSFIIRGESWKATGGWSDIPDDASITAHTITGADWNSVEVIYPIYNRDIVYLSYGIEIQQTFHAGTFQSDTSDGSGPEILVDNVEVIIPDALEIANKEELSQSISAASDKITVKFNYSLDDLWEDTVTKDNVKLTNTLTGKTVDITPVANGADIDVMINEQLEPNSDYYLSVNNIKVLNLYEKLRGNWRVDSIKAWGNNSMYAKMAAEEIVPMRTSDKLDITDMDYSDEGLSVVLRSHMKNKSTDVYVLAYEADEKDVAVSDVYYKKTTVAARDDSHTVKFTGINISDYSRLKVALSYTLDETLTSLADMSYVDVTSSKKDSTVIADISLPDTLSKPTVTAVILKPDSDGNATTLDITSNPVEGSISNIYALSVLSDSDNEFVYTSAECTVSGDYKVILSANGKVFAVKEVFISNYDDNKQFLYDVNSVSGTDVQKAEALYTILETEDEEQKIRLEDKYYDLLDLKSKSLLAQNLCECIPYENIDDFSKAFEEQTALLAMIRSTDSDVLYNALKSKFDVLTESKVAQLLKLQQLGELSVYQTYDTLDESVQKSICAAISENINSSGENFNVKTAEEFAGVYAIEVINNRIDATIIHTEIGDIIKDHKDILSDINYEKYTKLGDKRESVNAEIKNNLDYETLEKFIDFVNSEINDALEKKTNTGTSPKRDGKSPSYSVDTVTQIQTPVNTPAAGYFDDLGGVEWAENAINGLCERGIINGKGNGKFEPNAFVTREEFIKMISVASKIDLSIKSEIEFEDVLSGAWYAEYVNAAAACGITKGMGDGNFGVGRNITRQDLFVMCANAAYGDKYADTKVLDSFVDFSEISDYAIEKIALLVNNGIVSGSDGRINPQANATRAEAAKIIYGLLGVLEGR